MRSFARLAFIASLALGNAQLHAADDPLRMLESGLQIQGWEGVGRIDFGTAGFCTGTLITDTLVLTAAHCLFDRSTGQRFADGDINFRAGLRNGRASAEGRVRRSAVHPGYDPQAGGVPGNIAHDLALLELTHPIRNMGVRPFHVHTHPRRGQKIGVVSYARDRSEVPALQEACDVLGEQPGAVLVMSCLVDFGASGAPVFANVDGQMHVVSVISAKGEVQMDGERMDVSLGVSLGPQLDVLKSALAVNDRRFVTAPGAGDPAAPRQMSAGGGARFLRP